MRERTAATRRVAQNSAKPQTEHHASRAQAWRHERHGNVRTTLDWQRSVVSNASLTGDRCQNTAVLCEDLTDDEAGVPGQAHDVIQGLSEGTFEDFFAKHRPPLMALWLVYPDDAVFVRHGGLRIWLGCIRIDIAPEDQ